LTLLAKENTTEIEEFQIEAAKQDPKSFEVLYDKYYTQIFTFVLSRVNDKEQTADITSQVFLKALINIKNFN